VCGLYTAVVICGSLDFGAVLLLGHGKMILFKHTAYWFFIAFLPLSALVCLNLRIRHAVLILIILAMALAFSGLAAFFWTKGYCRHTVVWFFVAAIFIVTFTLSEKTIPGFTNALRAACLSVITVVIPVAVVLLNQYWPTFAITHVSNISNYKCEKINENGIRLPQMATFHVKNQSQSVVSNVQVRYWLLSSEEGGKKETCTLSFSASNENFNFAPQEERDFLFSFGNAGDQSNRQFHHLFLIVQIRYRPLLWPFTAQKVWGVFHYSPLDCLWSTMRKEHPPRKEDFLEWYKLLDQRNISKPPIPICPKPNQSTVQEQSKSPAST